MNWQVVSRPEAENDISEIAAWYDSRSEGLGDRFVEEVLSVPDELATNPFLHCQRHPKKNIRWRYPKSFSYRVVYEALDADRTIVVAAVLHAARDEREWKRRIIIDSRG